MAALDVFDDEPLAADHPLRKPLLTPHLGFARQAGVREVCAWRGGVP